MAPSAHLAAGAHVPFVASILLIAVVASLLRGGALSRIPEAALRWPWLLFVGVAVQLAVDLAAARGLLTDAGPAGWALLLLSQLLVVVFLIANWHRPGMLLVALGLALNGAVMAANGAMPVDPAAIAALGLEGAQVPPGKHTLLTDATQLPWLADIIPVPPIRTIISIGDIVLAVGLIPLTHSLMGPPPPRHARPGWLARQRVTRTQGRTASATLRLMEDGDPQTAVNEQ